MRIRSFAGIAAALAAVTMACEGRSAVPSAPAATPGREVAGAVAAPPQLEASSAADHAVTLFDACDPDTFDAAIGPGTCTRPGGVRFDDFVAQLTKHHSIGAWHFAPSQVTMRVGQQLVANNRGGEGHTFTEVDDFGGGNVPFLNNLVGLTTVASGCNQAVVIPPGGSSSETEQHAGVEKYQCCIHPWMRAEVRIVDK